MKKFFSFLLLWLVSVAAMAVPAKPGLWRTLKLTDGTEVRAQLAGDEHLHFWLADDGSRYVAHGDDTFIRLTDQMVQQRLSSSRRSARMHAAPRLLSPKKVVIGERTHYLGQKKGLVILVEYTNQKFRTGNDSARYYRIFNEEGYSEGSFRGSVSDYFKAQSNGQFELDFDVMGPVTLPHPYSYYGANNSNGDDVRAEDMVIEGCQMLDSHINFPDYDWDGDGEVDQVYVVYAGQGEADGGADNTVWPHMWMLDDAGKSLTLDGVKINTYACSNEVDYYNSIEGIGTFCHEFSHCLGFPDFYDISYAGWFGMGTFDLMCSGSYNGNGFCPPNYTAHEKMMCGWQEPTVLAQNDTIVENMQSIDDHGETFIIYNDAHPDEYYMIENRQKTGWDTSYPSRGLMITHVDFDADIWACNVPNTRVTSTSTEHQVYGYPLNNHERMTLFRANNSTSSYSSYNFLYPYNNNDSLTATSRPAATLHNENSLGTKLMQGAILNIVENDDGTMGFTYRAGVREEEPDDPDPYEDEFLLLYESFNKCNGTGGNDNLWSGTAAVAVFNPDHEGWTMTSESPKMYGANKCARFGTSTVGGMVGLPTVSMKGTVFLSFLAGAWDGKNDLTTMQVMVKDESNDAYERNFIVEPSAFEIEKGAWTDCTVTITETTGAPEGTVTLMLGTGRRFFLDEVRVVKEDIITAVRSIATTPQTHRIYTLDGRYVGIDLSTLGRGIYVQDGKKIIK